MIKNGMMILIIALLVAGCVPDYHEMAFFGVVNRIEPTMRHGWGGSAHYILHTTDGRSITVGSPHFAIGDSLRTHYSNKLYVENQRGTRSRGS